MLELLELIRSTYLQRTADTDEQKKIWHKLSEQFRPDLALYRTARPTTIIARETGDLGLSVLWIVQAAVIRPVLKELVLRSENDSDLSNMLSRVDHKTLCALAHSEDSAAPVILTEKADKYTINGVKKFITAGENAGLIITTCRKSGDEKISHVAIIDPSELPQNSLPDLKLNIMKSISHTKLILDNVTIKHFQIPRIPSSSIRRMMKKYGILERALILEAFISFLFYAEKILNNAGANISAYEELYLLMEKQSASASKQMDEGIYEESITTENIALQQLFPLIENFKKAYISAETILHESDKIKLKDIFLFDNLKG